MRVLVTGHEGYLGSVLVPRLTAAGHEVVGLDTGLFADCTLGPAPEPVPALRTDLREVTAEQLAEVAPDAVMHLAALCNDPHTARLSREHNDANVLSMGARIVALDLADEILSVWLATPFAGGRHQRRLEQIHQAET